MITANDVADAALNAMSVNAFAWLDKAKKEFDLKYLPQIERERAASLGIPHVPEDIT